MESAKTFRLFGDLWLEDPALYLPADELAEVLALQAKLHEFEKKSIGDPAYDLDLRWKAFGVEETQNHNRPLSELVKPSGELLRAALAARWNWPSFTTKNKDNATVSDETNPCILRLLKKGFNDSNTVMYEDYYRREKKGGRDLQSTEFRKLHKDFSEDFTSAMAAKVELVLSKDNRKYYQRKYALRFQEQELWGLEKPFSIYILYDKSLQHVSRIIVFVHHTEHFFHNWSQEATQEMDLKCNVAAKLAGIYEDIDPTYFQDRARKYTELWRSGANKLRHEAREKEKRIEQEAKRVEKAAKKAEAEKAKIAEKEARNAEKAAKRIKKDADERQRKAEKEGAKAAMRMEKEAEDKQKEGEKEAAKAAKMVAKEAKGTLSKAEKEAVREAKAIKSTLAKASTEAEKAAAKEAKKEARIAEKEAQQVEIIRKAAEEGHRLIQDAKRIEEHTNVIERIEQSEMAFPEADEASSKMYIGLMNDMISLEEGGSNFIWEGIPAGAQNWLTTNYPEIRSEHTLKAVAQAEWRMPRTRRGEKKNEEPTTMWRSIIYLYKRRLALQINAERWAGHVPSKPEGYKDDANRDELVINAGSGVTVAVKCKDCGGGQHDDRSVRWWATDATVYVERQKTCTSCGKKRYMVPVDASLKSIRGDTKDLKRDTLPGPDAPTGKKGVKRKRPESS